MRCSASSGKPVGGSCPDQAPSPDELAADIVGWTHRYFLVGDGTELAYDYLSVRGIPCAAAPENLRWQSAWGVAMAASDKIPGTADDLLPISSAFPGRARASGPFGREQIKSYI